MRWRRSWSDWAGFAFFTSIALNELVKTRDFSVLMMPLFVHPILTAATFLIRRPLVKQAPGMIARLSGYGGTFGIIIFWLLAQKFSPSWIAPNPNAEVRNVGVAMWLVGLMLDCVVVWSLRSSMSIVPQARALVTTGPYRFARHPLYATYVLQNVGLLLRFNTAPVAVAVAGWAVVTLLRIRIEEQVLSQTFPEFEEYRKRVWKFSPAFVLRRSGSPRLFTPARVLAICLLAVLWSTYLVAHGSPLTGTEKDFLRSLHIGGDPDRVRIHHSDWLTHHMFPEAHFGGVIPALPYHIFTVAKDENDADYLQNLAHEYAHVVACEKGVAFRPGTSEYGGTETLKQRRFGEFDSEQQAEIVSAYSKRIAAGKDAGEYGDLIAELAAMPERRVKDVSTPKAAMLIAARLYVARNSNQRAANAPGAGKNMNVIP